MAIAVNSSSKSLLGVTDLTLLAPIKRGLIPAQDSRSYATRLRLLLRTLNTLRATSLEAEPTPLVRDVIARIRGIHSFRLAIVGPDSSPQLLLSVAFDGGWETYMRRIWRDLGPLLDVMFCNCDGYLLSHDHTFADYSGWVRSAQVDTAFFYNATSLTVSDLVYLREAERWRRDGTPKPLPSGDLLQQALPALTALYRLADMYPTDTGQPAAPRPEPDAGRRDGAVLLRAARHLLSDLPSVLPPNLPGAPASTAGVGRPLLPTEEAALRWFAQAEAGPVLPEAPRGWDPAAVQGGIIEPYPGLSHGCLVLVELKDACAAHRLLAHLRAQIVSAQRQSEPNPLGYRVNLAFTLQGLQRCGVGRGALEELPFEFREGMAARASVLGDLRHNHPTRWALPARNWPSPEAHAPARVELSSVHAVVQFGVSGARAALWQDVVGNPEHPLWAPVNDLHNELAAQGVRILSVQALQRFPEPEPETGSGTGLPGRDHFGFVDGISQPTLSGGASPGAGHSDRVQPGDLLLGHVNSHGDLPLSGRLWDDSTFLVIRKLRQDVEAFESALPPDPAARLAAKAQLMGRDVDGRNLITGRPDNDFDYRGDADGARCPVHAHVRRANPRTPHVPGTPEGAPVPRILRRGMSYGPRQAPGPGADRGLVFMAYNASIAEQFETIQSWLSGGNSAGPHSYSGMRDPFLGVPQDDDPLRWQLKGPAGADYTVTLQPDRPFVTLAWGLYAFVPSMRALGELEDIAQRAAALDQGRTEADRASRREQLDVRRAFLAQQGAKVIGALRRAEQAVGFDAAQAQWKIVLEDVSSRLSGTGQAVWTAVRELNGGVLRTPFGVLVGSKALVMEVLAAPPGRYTATGYAERMRKSFGEIYLGLDAGPQYRRQAEPVNRAIQAVGLEAAFEAAHAQTRQAVARCLTRLTGLPPGRELSVDVKDIVDDVLAGLSARWFGIPDGARLVGGGWHWRSDPPPTCPGHFQAPSRYMFQPHPGPEAAALGQRHGQALKEAVTALLADHQASGTPLPGAIAQAIVQAFPGEPALQASTLVGVMMGFLPTVDGNLRGVLAEWVGDRSLWDLQAEYLSRREDGPLGRARAALLSPLTRGLQLRPVPELVWRIATEGHTLAGVAVNPGDRVVAGLVSAAHEALLNDTEDLAPLFGGDRSLDDAPTHACPGSAMAMGVMLGALAALLESAELRPTSSPTVLALRALPGGPPAVGAAAPVPGQGQGQGQG